MARSPVVSELYKDKIEIVLDNRQIFYLFFGGSVIVGLVFVLGVMVGRRVEARGHLERGQSHTAVDPLAALDRLAGGAGLSFQGELRAANSRPSEASNVAGSHDDSADKASQDVETKASERAADNSDRASDVVDAKKLAKAEDKKLENQKSEEKIADDKKSDAKKLDDKKSDNKKSDDKKLEDKKTEQKKLEETKSEPKKLEDAKPDDKKAEDKKPETKRVEDKKKPDDKKPEDKKSDGKKIDDKKPESKSKYALQLSSFQARNEAEAYLSQVKANGFGAYITEAEVDGKTYYRVRIGNYRSLDAANAAKADVEKAMKKSASVMKL